MKERLPKGVMLTNIRKALIHATDQPFPQVENIEHIYEEHDEPPEVRFAANFTREQGHFVFCESKEELFENLKRLTKEKKWDHLFCWDKEWQEFFISRNFRKLRIGKDLDKADVGITGCEALIARTGSIMISSAIAGGRNLSLLPPVHIVMARLDQLVPDIREGLHLIRKKHEELPSMVSMITGPACTTDIENTLVTGTHGPEEVYVFLLDKQEG